MAMIGSGCFTYFPWEYLWLKNSRSQWIAKNLQRLLNVGLIMLAAILVVFW